jgi:outer membrane protein OmpA-like peptidoglycan-associated protein
VEVVPASEFRGDWLPPEAAGMFGRIASLLAANPGLRVEVDAYSDGSEEAEAICNQHADTVRDLLLGAGVPADAIAVRSKGNSEPLASNATAAGRKRNRRVEVVIFGEPIGNLASWDRTYNIGPR